MDKERDDRADIKKKTIESAGMRGRREPRGRAGKGGWKTILDKGDCSNTVKESHTEKVPVLLPVRMLPQVQSRLATPPATYVGTAAALVT